MNPRLPVRRRLTILPAALADRLPPRERVEQAVCWLYAAAAAVGGIAFLAWMCQTDWPEPPQRPATTQGEPQ